MVERLSLQCISTEKLDKIGSQDCPLVLVYIIYIKMHGKGMHAHKIATSRGKIWTVVLNEMKEKNLK